MDHYTSDAGDLEREPEASGNEAPEIDLLLADSWNTPLWKRLLSQIKDRVAPEHLPPLELTSRPANLGMLQGDRLAMPWYRTVFTNIGDVISPETLPPLELESAPEDVGELIADQMAHPWWTSLLRNLADRVAPERLPPLQLTSKPMDPGMGSDSMLLPKWSMVINTPKVFLPDKPKPQYAVQLPRPAPPKPDPVQVEFVHVLELDLKRDLRRSIFRQRVWVTLAVVEVLALIGTSLFWK